MGIEYTLAGHQKDLGGGFLVRRLLPSAKKQAIGPFIFFDHFGPATELPSVNHDVRPHPHIGLATVTYLFDGAIMHRDSLGSVQEVTPGAINWMTAGRGIVHSERRPERLANQTYVNHGLQLWVALPEEHEEVEPSFVHTPASAIPSIEVDGARVRVLVGTAFGETSPVATYSDTLYLDVQLNAGAVFTLPPLAEECALYPVDGDVAVDGVSLVAGAMGVLTPGAPASITCEKPVRLMVIGGASMPHRYIWWNFVSSSKDRIMQASADYEAGRIGHVEGDDEWIPLPERRFLPS